MSLNRVNGLMLTEGTTALHAFDAEEVDVNLLTIDATDPKSGTAEFKAAAIRIEKLTPAEAAAASGAPDPVETTA